jgi:HK97 family phage prohead protease
MTSAVSRTGHEGWDELVVHRDLSLKKAEVEVRADQMGKPRFYGHAAVFNERTAIGNPLTWGFYEQIAPGAFSKTLGEGDARMLIDHDSYYIVSRVSAGTLLLSQDARGLVVDSTMDGEVTYVRDLEANLRNGNFSGMSFGFTVTRDMWTEEPAIGADGNQMIDTEGNAVMCEMRTIQEVKLIEVSVVTFPAYEQTDAGLRHSLVVALRRRGDRAAIERTLRHRPELADELSLPGEALGDDTPITAAGGTFEPSEERTPTDTDTDRAPAETTRETDGQQDPTDDSAPAASTRRPLRRELVARQTEAIGRRLGLTAA